MTLATPQRAAEIAASTVKTYLRPIDRAGLEAFAEKGRNNPNTRGTNKVHTVVDGKYRTLSYVGDHAPVVVDEPLHLFGQDTAPAPGEIVLSEPSTGLPALNGGGAHVLIGGGWDGWQGPYVSFNRVDQGALLAGGSAALAAAICFIPAVGQAACVAAVAIVAIAVYYGTEYGRCPTSRPNLREYVWSNKTGCYS